MSSTRVRAIAASALIVSFVAGSLPLLRILRSNAPQGPRAHLPAGRVYDFGEIEEGESIKRVFPIENIGSDTLRILNVATGCGCTSANVNATEINPGENAEIEICYNGRRVRERESLVALVQTNDAENPYLEFMLTGFVQYKVFWYPNSLSFFGESGHVLEPKQIIFTAPRRSNDTFELEVTSVSNSMILTELLDDERGVVLRVTVSPDCPRGAYGEHVVIKHANDESIKPISIPVYVKIL